MGCAGSKAPEPEPEPEKPKAVDDDEMKKIREKLAASADKGGFKKDKTFRRKFDGFKVGGGSRHNIHRSGDSAETEAINAKIREKNGEAAPSNPIMRALTRAPRSFTRAFTRGSNSSGSANDSFGSGSSSFKRTMSRMFTRGKKKSLTDLSSEGKTDEDYQREHDEHLASINKEYHGDSASPDASPSEKKKKGVKFGEPSLEA